MTVNEGKTDRMLRAVLGAALLALALLSNVALFTNPTIFWGAVIVGAVLVLTAATGFCPAYRLFGLRTCRVA